MAILQNCRPSALKLLVMTSLLGSFLGLLQAHGWLANSALDDAIAAHVNAAEISQIEYQRALKLFLQDKREVLTTADRQLIMQRLIEEELLVQWAIQIDLLRFNPQLRSAVLESQLAGLDIQRRAAGNSSNSSLEVLSVEYLAALRESADIHYGRR